MRRFSAGPGSKWYFPQSEISHHADIANNVMEYRFRTILGSTSVPMGPDQGFERMTSLRHMRELPVDDRTPRSNVGGLPDIDSEVPAVVVMEVDNEGS